MFKMTTWSSIWHKWTDLQTWRIDLWLPRQGGGWGRDGLISRCKLLHIEQISKVLLYSMGSYTQYPVIKHNGKEYKKEPVQFSLVTQSCPTLWDPMDCSMPGLPVHHQFLEFTQTHVHWVGDAIQPSHPLSSPSPPAFNISQNQSLFQWVSSLHQVAKILEFQLQHQSFQWIFRTDFL